MTHFIKNGNTTMITDQASFDIRDHLPAGTYAVKQNARTLEFYLEDIENFTLPEKLYGDIRKTGERIYNTFKDRPNGTGALLGGEKGSGKTLLTKVISERARVEDGVPTLVINSPFLGEEFNQFIQHIDQEAIILFDEFEKVYNREDQEKILTLLDGVYPTKKLYLLTVNDEYGINKHMVNRPGRLYYRITYSGLGADFVRAYGEDMLSNIGHVDSLVRVSELFTSFNFDMLKSIVEECNRYAEDPVDVVKVLNARPESDGRQRYTVEVRHDSGRIAVFDEKYWSGNPFMSFDLYVELYKPGKSPAAPTPGKSITGAFLDEDDSDDYEYKELEFEPSDYKGQTKDGKMVFQRNGFTVALTRYVAPAVNTYAYSDIEF